MSENAEGYWAIFLGNVSATLRMISHEWTWGPLVIELPNAFAKTRQWNEWNTEQPCEALHKSHKAIQNLPHMFVHANPVLVAPHTWISRIDVSMFCCRWPDVFQRSYWYGVFPVEIGKIGETM
jgi:hypothetical protein